MYGPETILKVHLFGEDFKLGSFKKKTLGNKLTDKRNFSNYKKKKSVLKMQALIF